MRTLRVIAIFSIAAAAACVSSVERRDVVAAESPAQAAHESIAALHAAIPATPATGNVFEYATEVPVPAEKVAHVDPGGQVFEYN